MKAFQNKNKRPRCILAESGPLRLLLFYVHTEGLFLVLRRSLNSDELCANKQSACWLIISNFFFFLIIYQEHFNQNGRQSD